MPDDESDNAENRPIPETGEGPASGTKSGEPRQDARETDDGYALADEEPNAESPLSWLDRTLIYRRPPKPPPERESRQLTLAGMLVVVSILSFALAPLNWLPMTVYAGVLGFVVFVLLAMVSLLRPRLLIVQLTLWLLLATYVATTIVACAQSN